MMSFVKNVVVMLVREMIVKGGFRMKDKLKEFAFFMFRGALAGLIILLVAGIIYGVIYALVVMTGIEPQDNYSFGYYYLQAGFWIGFFALVGHLKEYWRY